MAVAIPAGFEPATHGVEIRYGCNLINDLSAPCTIGVPSSPGKPNFQTFGAKPVGFAVGGASSKQSAAEIDLPAPVLRG
jgi:hypothetical protein